MALRPQAIIFRCMCKTVEGEPQKCSWLGGPMCRPGHNIEIRTSFSPVCNLLTNWIIVNFSRKALTNRSTFVFSVKYCFYLYWNGLNLGSKTSKYKRLNHSILQLVMYRGGRNKVPCYVVFFSFRGWARGPLYLHHAPGTELNVLETFRIIFVTVFFKIPVSIYMEL
jgi:hypothetical protein